MFTVRFLLEVLFVVFSASISNASNIIYVDVNSPNDPGTGSYEDPLRRIQDAIDIANIGDTIEIRPGTYTGEGNYDLDPNSKSVIIRSVNPNDLHIVASTIINPENSGRGFCFRSGEDVNCVVSGLTIRNGYTTGSGGAIYCINSSPAVSNCFISSNAGVWGGGGIYCYSSDLMLTNCLIVENTANTSGGGIKFVSCNKPILVNCTVSSNSAEWFGGGIYCYDSNPLIANCIFWANSGQEIYVESGDPVVTYCDIQDGWPGGIDNISSDPCFVSFEPNGTPNLWDFHLRSIYGRWDPNSQKWIKDIHISPCIDGGDPNSDWSAEPWPNGKRINMGVYGGTSQASMNGNVADFNIDWAVNFVDFVQLADKWLDEGSHIEDLNGDKVIDFSDLGIFIANWLWQKE